MIRPIVIAEYHQSRLNLVKAVVVVTLIALALRLIGGAAGVLLGLFGLLPSVMLAGGSGTFTEEFSKGQLRFLYGLPVSRAGTWCVKCVSGFITVFLMMTIICVILFAFPGDDLRVVL